MSPNDLGKNTTVEDCQRFAVSDYLENFNTRTTNAILGSILEVFCTPIHLTTTPANLGGVRYWFKCPRCEHRLATLLIHPITNAVGCRRCLGVIYRVQKFRGMAEATI